jgi:hypothetical protein
VSADLAATLTDIEQNRLQHEEAVIERGLATFVQVGRALAAIRDQRLYRATHGTFEAYCDERWNLSRPRAYELISAAEITERVSEISDIAPTKEGQAKELRGLTADIAAEVMQRAHDGTSGKVTAAAIREARQEVAPRPVSPPAPDPLADKIAAELAASDEDCREQARQVEPSPAVTDYLTTSQGLKDSGYVREFMGALHRSHAVLRFDAERLADLLDDAEIKATADHAASLARFADTLRRSRSGLRVINGGNR